MYVQSSIGFVLFCTNQATSGGPDIAIQTSHLLDLQVANLFPQNCHLEMPRGKTKHIPIVVTSPVL